MVHRGGGLDLASLNGLSERVLQASFRVHSALGPGLLESAYETCLDHEMRRSGLVVERQRTLPIHYDGVFVDAGYRVDLLVEQTLILEIKSVRTIVPIHEAQLLTYLKLSGLYLGLILNFNVKRLKRIAISSAFSRIAIPGAFSKRPDGAGEVASAPVEPLFGVTTGWRPTACAAPRPA